MTDAAKTNALIEAKSAKTIALSEKIWNFAEPNWREVQSAKALEDALCAEGFSIETMPCGMETAFVATYANGGPVIAYVCEYDALPGLSQEAGVPCHTPLDEHTAGHGCGHNLLGAGSFAAAVALKDYCVETGLAVTIQCFGCPAEEDGGGKVFFARDGYFDHTDAVFAWHPGSTNYVSGQGNLAIAGVLYRFKGRTAHAACTPFAGRSALDAAELMSVGCNYLREHIIPEARIHYAYRDVGGTAPNVVQESACVHYFIRAPKVTQMLAVKERIADVARGAALMTGTVLTIEEVDGFCDYVPNRTLSELLGDCMQTVGAPEFDAADHALADAFAHTLNEIEHDDNLVSACKAINVPLGHFKNKVLDETIPAFIYQPDTAEMGSTDVGDVSYCAPTAQCYYATMALGTGGHTWQMTAQSNTSIGIKGMLQAAKALALAGVRAAQNPALLAKAKAEHAANCPDGYHCPLAPDAVPGPIL
ncbi:MAG: amidohydrolase [Ruthenibacterium sp.]